MPLAVFLLMCYKYGRNVGTEKAKKKQRM